MGSHGKLPAPADQRPYRAASASGPERTVYHASPNGEVWNECLRQIGWHGQSGAFYALDEAPSDHEPGSFSPVWIVVHADRVETPEPEDVAEAVGCA